MGYKENRKRVYEIYNIDISDKSYNCHHIVTKHDLKIGIVPSNFDINDVSNLAPIKVRDHNNLHKYLFSIEKNNLAKKKLVGNRFSLRIHFANTIPEHISKISDLPFTRTRLREGEPGFWSWLKFQNKDEIFTRQQLQIWQQQGSF